MCLNHCNRKDRGAGDYAGHFRSIRSVRSILCGLMSLLVLSGCAGQSKPVRPIPAPTPAPVVVVTEQLSQLYGNALDAMHQQRLRQADIYLQQIIDLEPKLSAPYVMRGRIAELLDDKVSAKHWYETAIATNGTDHRALNQLAMLAREEGNFSRSQELYEQAIQLQPQEPLYHKNYAILLDLYLGQLARALEHYELFQKLQNKPDEQVALWVVDLKRRI